MSHWHEHVVFCSQFATVAITTFFPKTSDIWVIFINFCINSFQVWIELNGREMKDWFSGVTILLSLTIFLNTVSEIIPITSDSPLIGNLATKPRVHIFFCPSTFLRFVPVPVSNWNDRTPSPPPFPGAGTFFSFAHTLHHTSFLSLQLVLLLLTWHGFYLFVDKVSLLGVAIMLSMTIFQSLIAETTPVSNSSPIIGISTLRKQIENILFLKIWTSKPFEDLTCN